MAQKLNLFFRRYSTPAMWAAGGLTLLALILSRLSLSDPLANALYIAAFLLAGSPILFRAVQGLRFQVVGIECLVSIAVIGACWIGEFSEAAIVTFLFQFGSFLEQKTMAKTRSSVKALTELAPATAWRLTDGEPEEIDADEVEEGNLLLVKTGGQIAADGTVVRGDGYVNEAGITGESQPRHKTPGASLYAGTILESGTLVMEAVKVGEDTTFSKIIQLVEEAQDAKSPVERFIDRFARYYTPAVVVMAALTLIFTRNLDMAITVLVLACPGALVIGAPIANVAGIGRGAQEGVLLKGGDSVHTFAKTDTVLFDKTGTLTVGRPQVTDFISYCESPEYALSLAASAEQSSDHPLSKAIVQYARQKDLPLVCGSHAETQKGLGLTARIDGHHILVGSEKLLAAHGITIPEDQHQDILAARHRSTTTVLVAVDGVLSALLSISDALKPEAADCIRRLQELGVRNIAMVTGDNAHTAKAIAAQAEIPEVHPECLPQDKAELLKQLQRDGHTVTFVGDGINDSPALMTADIGIAMGSGTDVAVDSSDVVLIKSDLTSLVAALRLAKKTKAVMYQNIVIAVGTVILLLVGLFLGFVHMALGMLIHEASILVVIFNAMRLIFLRGEQK